MGISLGKLKGLNAVSDEKGIIRAAAMDQRGSLVKAIAKARGTSEAEVTRQDLEQFKEEVSRALTPYASAILLDPEYGLPASRARSKNTGLLLAYEVTGYEQNTPGRMPRLIPDYTVKRLKSDGADCVKLLLYYTPDEDEPINQRKRDFVKRVGEECAREDIPFFLECVGYNPSASDGKTLDYARNKPRTVTQSIQEFTKEPYGVDVLKVEVPIQLKYTEGTKAFKGEKAYSLKEALEFYKEASQAATKPFIYLSSGVSSDEFIQSIELAVQAGSDFSGVLCGRATWQEGIPHFAKGGRKELAEWLAGSGVQNVQRLNEVLSKGAKPWQTRHMKHDT